ncbi:DUF488 domain-containing protein [Amycolatopsis sp.]|uniref:DUF488 domain-containing protein n=1 Tax=Amycolatopsis sp. TaxID=37632 RepID=UPI002DFFE4A5|nr:DUF488 domain-containing protein [Amycolatopsis sp.]
MTVTQTAGVLGVGYEGREIVNFVADLVERQVSRLVDVRLTPISRKRGFSKTALRTALAEAGIAYDHRRELGNPKDNRAGFGGSEAELERAKAAYTDLLTSDGAQASLDELGDLARTERIALLCFEADERRCHRDVVLGELARRLSPAARR